MGAVEGAEVDVDSISFVCVCVQYVYGLTLP
jgi:hypothetical protein